MPNRVTFSAINDLVQTNLADNFRKLSRFQEQLSSGKRLQRPSDGPVDITNDLQFRSDLRQYDQFARNIDDGVSYMAIVESTLVGTNEYYQRARELSLQASNDTNTAQERSFIMNEVRIVLDSLISSSNQTFKGNFIFSGTNTKTQPYELRTASENISTVPPPVLPDVTFTPFALGVPIQLWDEGVSDVTNIANNPQGHAQVSDIIPGTFNIPGLTEGSDYTVDYLNGMVTFLATGTAADPVNNISFEWIRRSQEDLSGVIKRELEPGVTSQINTTVDDVFGSPTDVTSWDAMIELMQGLHLNDSQGIRSSVDQLNDAFTRSLDAQSTAGARTNRLDLTKERNEEFAIETTRLHSELEDVDFAKVISDFVLQESIYTASLQSGARVIQPTLANFL